MEWQVNDSDVSESEVWASAYTAALGGMMMAAGRIMWPHQRPSMDSPSHGQAISEAAGRYADEAVAQYRKRARRQA